MNNFIISSDETNTIHTISFEAVNSIKAKLMKQLEKDKKKNNLMLVNDYIEQFNKDNDNIIKDYNYEIVNDNEFNIVILFKHILRNFKEPQRYAKINIKVSDECILIQHNKHLNIPLDIPTKAELAVISFIKLTSVPSDTDTCINTILFTTFDKADKYPNFKMVIALFESILQTNIKHI